MLNSTFSSSSVRGWRQQEEGNITLPATFSFINSLKNDISQPTGPNLAITDNGEFIFASGITAFPPANIVNSLRVVTNYLTNFNAYNLTANRPSVYAIDSMGNLAVFDEVNNVIQLNQFNSNLTFTNIANISAASGTLSYSGDGKYLGSINGARLIVYEIIGNSVTEQANIAITIGFDSFIDLNKTGNYLVIGSATSNSQIYSRSGNTWSFESNISGSATCIRINDYGNIVAGVYNQSGALTISSKISNVWSTLNTFYSNVVGLNSRRLSVDMNGEGTVIASSIRYTANLSPANNEHRIAIYNFNSANANYELTQNLFQNLSNVDMPISSRNIAMSKNLGYLVAYWGSQTNPNQGVELYSCL